MSHTLTVFNLKGGTAKSTTCVNVGAVLAERDDQRVLLVDCDAQGSASKHLGVRVDGRAFRDVLVEGEPIDEVVAETPIDGLELVPGGEWLTDVEPSTAGEPLRELRLRRALEGLQDVYDWILFDPPASTGLMNTSALLAAENVLIPVEAQGAAVDGLVQALDLADEIDQARDDGLSVIGAMVVRYDTRTSLSREADRALRERFGDLMLETIVNRNVRVAEAYAQGVPVTQHAPSSRGADDYRDATTEIAERIGR